MHVSIITLFPELFEPYLTATVLGRAVQAGRLRVDLVPLRAYGEGRHQIIDDRPFGGGPGMVLMAEPVIRCVEATRAEHGPGVRTLLLTPQGRRFDQPFAEALATHEDGFILLCGRYEGIDERAIEILQPEELSVGDYVLSGGEAGAMVVLDATARLVPGVLGDERSPKEDSFSGADRILDHPHYTRPLDVRGLGVPEVLRSGNHAEIARWRRARALERTRARRPDLLTDAPEGDQE
ncbi:MAG: tRNA (guanosine(37)-N1)-methyltransferase TrmD [Planctomycetota bacterium]|nr:tRNA (guanosine(37)-N1)-methyltransferase TrmD [Planctomycetota bacterium]